MKKLAFTTFAIIALSLGVNAQDDVKKKNNPAKPEKKESVKSESSELPPAPAGDSRMAINEKPVDTRPKTKQNAASTAPKSGQSKKDELKKDKND
jgi:hypothetical protein